jgi:hypothetical protein
VIYLIDNGMIYSSKTLYFVEAPEDFKDWFEGILLSWLKQHSMRGEDMKIVGRCTNLGFSDAGYKTMTVKEFLEDDMIVESPDYGESPPEPRPRYQGEEDSDEDVDANSRQTRELCKGVL